MTAPATTSDLLDLARAGGVVSDDALASLLLGTTLPAAPGPAAGVLVRAGLLTQFQANWLLAGDPAGLRVGGYLLAEPVGRGGSGVVYRAEHVTLQRTAAVKILSPADAADPVAVGRFLREARAAAALDHPNIVRVFDVGRKGGAYYLAMEFVAGETLAAQVQRSGPLAWRAVAEVGLQAAAGLAHAHARGIVHRDIKPGNLMRAVGGHVKILDMGLARSGRRQDDLTATFDRGAVLGTPDTISPEQTMGHTADGRADIYSLGATLYILAAGRPPFSGNTTQKLLQHQLQPPPPLAEVAPTVPAGLAAAVHRMLAKDPAARFQTAAEVADVLAAFAHRPTPPAGVRVPDPPPPARPPGGIDPAPSAGRRVRGLSGWLAAVTRLGRG